MRRGRDARGERLLRGGVRFRLVSGGELRLAETGERLRGGVRDLAARGARLRLLSLSRAELCTCDLSRDRRSGVLGRRLGLLGDALLAGSSRLERLSGETDRLRDRRETGL
jgi:hypothetical protein